MFDMMSGLVSLIRWKGGVETGVRPCRLGQRLGRLVLNDD